MFDKISALFEIPKDSVIAIFIILLIAAICSASISGDTGK